MAGVIRTFKAPICRQATLPGLASLDECNASCSFFGEPKSLPKKPVSESLVILICLGLTLPA
jgi:hypothetical protein